MLLWNKSAQCVYCREQCLTLAFPSGEGGLTRRPAEVKTDEETEIKQQAFSPHPSAESLRFAPLAATFLAGEGFYMQPRATSIFHFLFTSKKAFTHSVKAFSIVKFNQGFTREWLLRDFRDSSDWDLRVHRESDLLHLQPREARAS